MVSGLLAGAAGGASVSILINAVDNFSGVFSRVNKSMLAIGAGVTALGVAGLSASKSFVNTAAAFESAFTGVRKTVELTDAEFAQLRTTFKDLSKEIPVSFIELSKIGEVAGQLGVEGVKNISKFTRVMADIGVTTNMSAEVAATAFARIANIMQLPLDQVDKMGSAVVDLGNNFATTEGEIVMFAERVAGAANIVGLTTQDILAIGAAMTSVGVEAEAGGTAVQKMLLKMNEAVIEGNANLAVFAKTAGVSSEQFQKDWEKDAGGSFSRFITGLGEQGDGAIKTLEELRLKDVRLVRAFLSLSNAGDLVTDTFAKSNKAWDENNALTEEAAKRYATVDSQAAILTNKFDNLKDQMGQTLIPAFITLVDILGKVIGWFEKHPTLTKFAVAALAIGSALAIVAGPIIMLIAIWPLFATGLAAASAGFVGLSLAMAPILLPILGIIAALGLAILAYKAFKKFFGKESKSVGSAKDAFKTEDGTIFLNPNTEQMKQNKVIALNDFILTPSGQIIKPHANDTIIGTKNPNELGGRGVVVNIENVYGTDPDQMMEAFQRELNNKINFF